MPRRRRSPANCIWRRQAVPPYKRSILYSVSGRPLRSISSTNWPMRFRQAKWTSNRAGSSPRARFITCLSVPPMANRVGN